MIGDIDNQIFLETRRIEKMNRIQDELNHLDKSLNSCIEIVEDSISNKQVTEKLNRIKEENEITKSRANNEIDLAIQERSNSLSELREKKKNMEEKEDDEKGSE